MSPPPPPSVEVPDIREAWLEPASQALLRAVIERGMFGKSPSLGAAFVDRLDGLCGGDAQAPAIYADLASFLHHPDKAREFEALHGGDEQARIDRRVSQLTGLMAPLGKPTSFCDVGCGTGVLTGALAKAWGLSAQAAFGTDVFDRLEEQEVFTPVPVEDDSVIPLPDDSVALVLLLMTLHHEADAAELVAEVKRVLAPGGWVLVREADAAREADRLFHAVLDHLYYAVYHQLPGIPTPGNHRPVEDWTELFESFGFRTLVEEHPEPESPIKPVHLVFVNS